MTGTRRIQENCLIRRVAARLAEIPSARLPQGGAKEGATPEAGAPSAPQAPPAGGAQGAGGDVRPAA